MPDWKMKGEDLKNCNCVQSCPCDTNGNPAPHKTARAWLECTFRTVTSTGST